MPTDKNEARPETAAAPTATVLAAWGFEGVTTTNTGTTPVVSVGSATADSGTQTTGSSFTALHASSSTVWSNPSGNGSTKSLSSNNWAIGDYIQFLFTTTGDNSISITWDQTGSSTGPRDFKVQYSTNGTTFTDASGTNSTYAVLLNGAPNVAWTSATYNPAFTMTLDLSSVTALNNQATVYIRLVNTSTTSTGGGTVATTGTERIDNFSVSGASTAAIHVQHVVDFDGEGKTDFAVVRNSGGADPGQLRWYYNINSSNAPTASFDFGLNTDVLVPADYDGDSKTDIAVWRGDSSPAFYILQSKTNTVRIEPFGLVGDDPTVVADYNGDGSADVAVYRPGVGAGAQSYWFYRTVAGGPTTFVPWGIAGDKPAPGYYDGDAKADFGIVRTEGANLRWWTLTAAGVTDGSTLFGIPGDTVITGDFDNDGITDKAVVRSSGGSLIWYVNPSKGGGGQITFGLTGDKLAPGDYDGDGKTDLGVYRNGVFYVFLNNNSGVMYFQLGVSTDRIPAAVNTHPTQ